MQKLVFSLFGLLNLSIICCAWPSDMDSYLYVEPDSEEHGQSLGPKSTNCSCGWTNKARIVGGKETLKNEYPLIVGISTVKTRAIFCGGTIITSQHVLTAAHCTYPKKGHQFIVYVGEHDQSKSESGEQIIEVEKIFDHENYVHKQYKNDISLFFLKQKIEFSQIVGPACLPSKRSSLLNEFVKALGWGKLGNAKKASLVLMKVNVRVIPLQECHKKFLDKNINLEEPTQICTYAKNKDSCQGDSGGPLIWLDPDINRYTLVALVSFGKTKCATDAPAVNTDVSAYLDWIQEKISISNPEMQTCAAVD